MGTWGDGLYDNDGALDELARLIRVEEGETSTGRLVAEIGLLTWMRPGTAEADAEALGARVAAVGEEVARLPDATQQALARLLADPAAATAKGSRTGEAEAILGGYNDGPRIDALLRFPGAEAAIDALVSRCAARLDRTLTAGRDLYEVAGGLAALGVLVELALAGLWRPTAPAVDGWRARFDACDRATKEERRFWWKYVKRVRRGLDALAPAPVVAPTKPIVRRRMPLELPSPRRFLHAKFGAATLVARTGAGDSETLELKFDDGTVRKVLARFVTPLAE